MPTTATKEPIVSRVNEPMEKIKCRSWVCQPFSISQSAKNTWTGNLDTKMRDHYMASTWYVQTVSFERGPKSNGKLRKILACASLISLPVKRDPSLFYLWWIFVSGLLIGHGKKVKFRGIFRGKFAGKICQFHGIFTWQKVKICGKISRFHRIFEGKVKTHGKIGSFRGILEEKSQISKDF